MKREYVKPTIYFESFVLSTNIASDCAKKTGIPTNGTCGLDMGGYVIFVESNTGCDIDVVLNGDGSYEGICYDVPTASTNLFNS